MIDYLNNIHVLGVSIGLVASILFWIAVAVVVLVVLRGVVRRAVRDGILDAARLRHDEHSTVSSTARRE